RKEAVAAVGVGLGLIFVVFEIGGSKLHVHCTRCAHSTPVTSVVENAEPPHRPPPSHPAGVLQPLIRRPQPPPTLPRPVVLVDHRPPPFEHLAFHVDRARRCRVNDVAQ